MSAETETTAPAVPAAGFDLAVLDTRSRANEGFEFEIVHPTTFEGTGLLVTVYGEDSDEYRQVSSVQSQKRIQRAVQQRGRTRTSVSEVAAASAEEAEENQLEILVACTKAWRMKDGSTVSLEGKPFPCTSANALVLYQRMPVVRKQVEAAIADRANFLAPSAKN